MSKLKKTINNIMIENWESDTVWGSAPLPPVFFCAWNFFLVFFEFFHAQKVFFTHKFYKNFTHSPALSRALCQIFSRMGSFLFYRLKSDFNGFVREIFLKNLIFSNFSRTKLVFHGHFLWFFHGKDRLFTQRKPIFFTYVCHFFTYKKKKHCQCVLRVDVSLLPL